MNIEFDSKTVYEDVDKFLKTKIKLYRGKLNTNFQGKMILKENASDGCLSLILLDSVIRANKKYYPQAFLEECKYELIKNKVENFINDDLDLSLFYEFDNGSNNELMINF